MTHLPFDVTVPNGAPRGRSIKFTPERMDQIRNLVERGVSREQIAETIGCTVGSLQVTCSRAGISLRHQRHNGTNGTMRPKLSPMEPPPRIANLPEPKPSNGVKATLSLKLESHGRTREFSVPFPPELIGHVAVLAAVQGQQLSELLVAALTECIHKLEQSE